MATNWNGSTADWYTRRRRLDPPGDPGPSSAVVINSGEPQLETPSEGGISVASISITGGLLAIQDPWVTQSVSGAVAVSGSGSLQLDGNNIGGAGGSSMTIGGTLTNSSSNGNAISIGNGNITSADTLTVNGSGGLIEHRPDRHRRLRHRPGDPERRQCRGGLWHGGHGDRECLPARRCAARVQERRDLDHRRRGAAQRRERPHRRRQLDHQQQRADGADDGRRKFLAAERRNG